jgi:hypothetical protein
VDLYLRIEPSAPYPGFDEYVANGIDRDRRKSGVRGVGLVP